MARLSPDLLLDILVRQPVKSLLRFRCLSKWLCSEIDSSDFVKQHLKRSMETKSGRKLILSMNPYSPVGEDLVSVGPLDFYAADFDDGLRNAIRLDHPLGDSPQCDCDTSISGTCNGLILLSLDLYGKLGHFAIPELVIWNPSTRKCKKLPACPAKDLPDHEFHECGLGYDSAADDYKVVMLSKVKNVNTKIFQIWVFSLKSNFWWLSQDLPFGSGTIICRRGEFANGAVYWLYQEAHLNEVCGFDLANETFFTLPSFCSSDDTLDVLLSAVDGYVLATKLFCVKQVQEFKLLAKDEGGAAGRGFWREVFSFEQQHEGDCDMLAWPLAFSKVEDSVLLQIRKDVFWYNLKRETKQNVMLRGLPQDVPFLSEVCWESLVSLGDNAGLRG